MRLIAEIVEPFHGRVLDPACGSGGVFVQSAGFVSEHKKNGGASRLSKLAGTVTDDGESREALPTTEATVQPKLV